MSHVIANEFGIFISACLILSEFFAVITTNAPFSDKILAIANPIPLLAPVTKAI